eukprot:TRINITY_DN51887_c0_g1_i1.p1 TRINITY_DN51887_c0_g1~~TRINITY_DN51887_c0_g1_i1.p1  ORF type:complete len:489 (-),score=83.18 TRINITY_DN51887_c0_g1_i1:253-1719(-)
MTKRQRGSDFDPALLEPGVASQQLAVSKADNDAMHKLVGQIVKALQAELHPDKIYQGGSFKKNTALNYKFDLDLVLFLNDFQHLNMESYMQRCRAALVRCFGGGVKFTPKENTPYCIRLEFDGRHVDLLITGTPQSKVYGNPERYYQAAHSPATDEEVMNAIKANPILRELILVAKHWRNLYERQRLCPSYYIELLAMKSIKSGGSLPPETVRDAFRLFLTDIFIRRATKVTNVMGAEFDHGKAELISYAKTTYYRPDLKLAPRREGVVDWKNNASASVSEPSAEPFAEGEFRFVYKGKYLRGERTGEACVEKIFKTGAVFEETFFQHDIKAVDKAHEIIDAFNALGKGKTVRINHPQVWTRVRDKQKVMVEPMIVGTFHKFNSNSGYTDTSHAMMQALSHFSFHHTRGECLLCDLQGGHYEDCYVLTDPVILSPNRQYGSTDLGTKGIENFFSHHRCTAFCNPSWLKASIARPHFTPQKGTTFMRLA